MEKTAVKKNETRAVLVVGGGVSGLQSALDLADLGFNVYLVDRSPGIGGRLPQIEEIFPTGTSAICEIAPKLAAVQSHPNIQLINRATLKKVQGEAGNFEVTIRKEPFLVNEKCDTCGLCVQVCPIKAYSSHNQGLSLRTAIDIEGPAATPAIYHIEKEIPACQDACPLGVDVRGYLGSIANGKFEEALALIRETNPLPGICGRVCHHPCEAACNRGMVDEPLAICMLKRSAADYELKLRTEGKPPSKPRRPTSGKKAKVAIVGSGPAGLTCAHDLARLGYEVTIFEKYPVAGGMLWVGIPEYRLPRDIIEIEIDRIKDLGVEIKTDTPVGRDLTLHDLSKRGYKAIFLAVGAHKGLKLRIPGEDDFEGFLDCVTFLRDVNLGKEVKIGEKVVVIGGGNAAIDSARVALRLGCKEVSILYRRSRKEMPANPWEIEEAEHEGVKIHYLASPTKILGKQGKVVAMECIRNELGKLDASGRRRPVPVKGSEFKIDCDLVIPAISQQPDLSFLSKDHGLEISRWNSFVVDDDTLATNLPGIFAGGDAVTGPATVIEAMAAGRKAATSIDEYLSG